MAAKTESARNDEDWQFNKSVIECNRHMLEKEIATDITFLVSDENNNAAVEAICAHKYVLISRSPVFYSMFCGLLAERGEIRVTDVHPEAFRMMLNYMYTDKLTLTLDLVIHLLYASKKYLLPTLTTKCVNFVKNHLNNDSVCYVLDQIVLFEGTDLNDVCLDLIMRRTKTVLETEAFMSISRATLSTILEIQSSEVKEVDLFKACLRWAWKKCDDENNEATDVNMRGALGECVNQLRFSDTVDFERDVCPTGVLTNDEEIRILQHLADRQAIPAPVGFNCEARLRPMYRVVSHRHSHGNFVKSDKLVFDISILSKTKNDLKVNTILVGKAPPLYRYSMKFNDADICCNLIRTKERWGCELKCNSEIIIKPGHSTLQIQYEKDLREADSDVEHVIVDGIPICKENTIKDGDRVELKLQLQSGGKIMPLLGFTCQILS